MVHGCRIFNG